MLLINTLRRITIKIRINYLSTLDKANCLNLIKNCHNGLYKYEHNKCFIYKNNKWEEFSIEFVKICDIEELPKIIQKLFSNSHKQVENWQLNKEDKDETFSYSPNYNDTTIMNDITIWLMWLDMNNMLDIINLCCWMAFKVLEKHYWENGNKRTSVLILINMLEMFNLHLCSSHLQSETNKEKWYFIFLDYLKRLERKSDGTKEDLITIYNDFYKEIKSAITLNNKYVI